jgi:hypothetical protein
VAPPATFAVAPGDGLVTACSTDTGGDNCGLIVVTVAGYNTLGVFYFDPETKSWSDPVPFDAAFKSQLKETNAAFYDPELKVIFVYSAGDSRDDGIMWAYKPKSRPAPGK